MYSPRYSGSRLIAERFHRRVGPGSSVLVSAVCYCHEDVWASGWRLPVRVQHLGGSLGSAILPGLPPCAQGGLVVSWGSSHTAGRGQGPSAGRATCCGPLHTSRFSEWVVGSSALLSRTVPLGNNPLARNCLLPHRCNCRLCGEGVAPGKCTRGPIVTGDLGFASPCKRCSRVLGLVVCWGDAASAP